MRVAGRIIWDLSKLLMHATSRYTFPLRSSFFGEEEVRVVRTRVQTPFCTALGDLFWHIPAAIQSRDLPHTMLGRRAHTRVCFLE